MAFLARVQKTLYFMIKAVLFFCLLVAFFLPYTPIIPFFPDIPGLINLSRTMAICYLTFAVLGICFIRIYGGFAIGVKKSKEITYSLFLATLVTDLITWVQLIIMSIAILEGQIFRMILALLVVMPFQFLFIMAFTRFGNFIFFKINEPRPCAVIYKDDTLVNSYIAKISKYKKQWRVDDVCHYESPDLKSIIKKNQTVFIFDVPHGARNDILEYCYKHNKNAHILPDVADVMVKYSHRNIIDDVMVFSSTLSELSFEQRFIKRVMDIVLSAICLIIASPIMIAEAIAIYAYDKGPVFFRQERMTQGGKVFKVIKFRTMIVDAEKNNTAVLSSKNDKRITPVGKVLRATRMDELPQLINILFGDMSFVGPRPERESIANEYLKELPEFRYRLKVKAGLTGLAQIRGKYNTTPKDKLTLDLAYIEQYSIWLDLKLMLQTFIVLFKSDSTEGFNEDDHIQFVRHEKEESVEDPKQE